MRKIGEETIRRREGQSQGQETMKKEGRRKQGRKEGLVYESNFILTGIIEEERRKNARKEGGRKEGRRKL